MTRTLSEMALLTSAPPQADRRADLDRLSLLAEAGGRPRSADDEMGFLPRADVQAKGTRADRPHVLSARSPRTRPAGPLPSRLQQSEPRPPDSIPQRPPPGINST